MSPDSQPLRMRLTDFLAPLQDINEYQARRGLIHATGFDRLGDRINWWGDARLFVNGYHGLLDAFAVEGQAQLAAFISKLPEVLSIPLGLEKEQDLESLIVTIQAMSAEDWEEQFPITDEARRKRAAQSIAPNPEDIYTGLKRGRAARQGGAGAAASKVPCDFSENAVWGYDLFPQENTFRSPFGMMPRYGIFRYNACDDLQLLETYFVPRMEHWLQDDRNRTLVEDKKLRIVLTENDLADANQALAVVNSRLKATYRKQLTDLVGKKGPDCFLTIVNWNVKSTQIEPFMASLNQQVLEQLDSAVQKNCLYLIILWIDNDSGEVRKQPSYLSLPKVELVHELESVVDWLDKVLEKAKVASRCRRIACDRLRRRLNSPIPWDVYEALRTTVDELKQGRI